jgi:6-phosphogluconolactonase/glucosamine-6-phosphate isomerase/deaminase
MKRVAFVVYVNLDEKPGRFYSKESAQNAVRQVLLNRIPDQDPYVTLAPEEFQWVTPQDQV